MWPVAPSRSTAARIQTANAHSTLSSLLSLHLLPHLRCLSYECILREIETRYCCLLFTLGKVRPLVYKHKSSQFESNRHNSKIHPRERRSKKGAHFLLRIVTVCPNLQTIITMISNNNSIARRTRRAIIPSQGNNMTKRSDSSARRISLAAPIGYAASSFSFFLAAAPSLLKWEMLTT